MELINIIRSKIDSTVKYVYRSDGAILEFSYIDKRDGKDIICVPTQSACKLGCKFCFMSDCDIPVRNLTWDELHQGITEVVTKHATDNKVLLVSFMGCGEPLCNVKSVTLTCNLARIRWLDRSTCTPYETARFAVASLIPGQKAMVLLTDQVREHQLKMKFHLSLHSPFDTVRNVLMPAALNVCESLDLVEKYMHVTGNSSGIHYALMDGINDREIDMDILASLIQNRNMSVKFLAYNEKTGLSNLKRSERVGVCRDILDSHGIKTGYYELPGKDVGSSCGQFLMDYYKAKV